VYSEDSKDQMVIEQLRSRIRQIESRITAVQEILESIAAARGVSAPPASADAQMASQ